MGKDCLLKDCILKWLNDGRYPQDLLRWVDEENKEFEIYFLHGNNQSHPMSREYAAQVFLGWREAKGKLENTNEMSDVDLGEYLSGARHVFTTALRDRVQRGIFSETPITDLHLTESGSFRRYKFNTEEEIASRRGIGKRKRKNSYSSCTSTSSCSSSSTASSPKRPRVKKQANSPKALDELPVQNHADGVGSPVAQSQSCPTVSSQPTFDREYPPQTEIASGSGIRGRKRKNSYSSCTSASSCSSSSTASSPKQPRVKKQANSPIALDELLVQNHADGVGNPVAQTQSCPTVSSQPTIDRESPPQIDEYESTFNEIESWKQFVLEQGIDVNELYEEGRALGNSASVDNEMGP